MKLHFGVIDIAYSYRQAGRRKKVNLSTTTGEVADRLEEKYHLFEDFYRENEAMIADELTKSLEGALEAVMSGAPVTQDPYGAATSKIEDAFKTALATNAFDWRIPGVPTAASGRVPAIRLGGINHRLKHPYSQDNPPRPSFIDTGTFQSSMKVWVE